MRKIFRYECRRLLLNKFFAGLVLVLLAYGAMVLESATILGVSHTAPFSPWSFGDYLSRMLPLLWVGASFFLTFFTSGRARRAMALTDAAPMDARRYAWARCAAALAGTAPLLRLVCVGQPAAPGAGDPRSGAGVRLGLRLAAGAHPPLAALSVDAPALCGGSAPARGAGAVERQSLHRPPTHPGDAGPDVHTARLSRRRPACPARMWSDSAVRSPQASGNRSGRAQKRGGCIKR